MDPFSISAGAVGITAFATASIVQLQDLFSGLNEAEDLVHEVASDLEGVKTTLASLEQLSISDEACSAAAKEDLKKAGVAEAVNDCGEACSKFTKNLQKWTKHSSAAHFSLRDRLSVGVWNKEKFRTFRTRVQSCKSTVQFAVASTQLMVQLRSERTSEAGREDVRKQLQALEKTIQEHLTLAKKQLDKAHERKQELQEEPDDEEDGGAQRLLAINEVDQQSHLLENDQVSCGVVFSQARSNRSGQKISNVVTSDDSKAFVGLPESVVGRVNQVIRGVTTKNRSTAVVGVFGSDLSMKDL